MTHLLFDDKPCRITQPGTFKFSTKTNAVYTVGVDYVQHALTTIMDETHGRPALDIETFGLGLAARRLKSVALSSGTHAVVLDPRDPYQANLIRHTFGQAEELILHNSPFDIPNLYLNGLFDIEWCHKISDTLIWSRLANPGERVRKSLTEAADRYLKTGKGGELERSFKALGLNKKDGFRMFDLDRPIYLQGAASDPLLTFRLAPVVRQASYDRLTRNHPFPRQGVTGSEAWDLVDREQQINRYIGLPRTLKGLRVDFEYLDQYQEVNAHELAEAEAELKAAGVAPNSAVDLIKILTERGELPNDHPLTKGGKDGTNKKPSTAAESLKRVASPLARMYVRHKEIEKVGNDYLAKVVELADDNGRVHPQTNLLAAATGRESMNDPPTHQFPALARPIIMFDEGDSGTSVDLSQGEPMTIANACQDRKVLNDYEESGTSLYVSLGVQSGRIPSGMSKAEIEDDPQLGKVYGDLKQGLLAQLYGQGLALLSAKLGLDIGPYGPPSDWEVEVRHFNPELEYPKYREAKQLRLAVFTAMPKTEEYIKKLKVIAQEHRMMITISGRILDIPMSQRFGKWSPETHKGPNYFCQGGQYDLIADAQIEMIRQGLADAIYFKMHDEFLCSTSASHDIQRILQTPSERFCYWAQRTPIIRTDMKILGKSWKK